LLNKTAVVGDAVQMTATHWAKHAEACAMADQMEEWKKKQAPEESKQ
jgi:hypothetical protein